MVTDYAEIAKDAAALGAPPNLADYEELRANWNWDDIVAELDLPGGSYNLAHECIDRHANGALADKIAMIYESTDGEVTNYTFKDMQREANKWANAITDLRHPEGRPRLLLHRPHPGALLRHLRHAEARRHHRPAVLGVWPRRGHGAHPPRRGRHGRDDA